MRTVPAPEWVRAVVHCLTTPTRVTAGRIFDSVSKTELCLKESISEKVIWCIVTKTFDPRARSGRWRVTKSGAHMLAFVSFSYRGTRRDPFLCGLVRVQTDRAPGLSPLVFGRFSHT